MGTVQPILRQASAECLQSRDDLETKILQLMEQRDAIGKNWRAGNALTAEITRLERRITREFS